MDRRTFLTMSSAGVIGGQLQKVEAQQTPEPQQAPPELELFDKLQDVREGRIRDPQQIEAVRIEALKAILRFLRMADSVISYMDKTARDALLHRHSLTHSADFKKDFVACASTVLSELMKEKSFRKGGEWTPPNGPPKAGASKGISMLEQAIDKL